MASSLIFTSVLRCTAICVTQEKDNFTRYNVKSNEKEETTLSDTWTPIIVQSMVSLMMWLVEEFLNPTVLKKSGPEVIKLFSCSTQLSMKFYPLINVKMPTIVGILTLMSGKNSIQGLPQPKTSRISWYFYTYEHLKFHAQLSWAWKKFYNLGANFSRILTENLSKAPHIFLAKMVVFLCINNWNFNAVN